MLARERAARVRRPRLVAPLLPLSHRVLNKMMGRSSLTGANSNNNIEDPNHPRYTALARRTVSLPNIFPLAPPARPNLPQPNKPPQSSGQTPKELALGPKSLK